MLRCGEERIKPEREFYEQIVIMINKRRLTLKFIFFDILTAELSWIVFTLFRKLYIEDKSWTIALEKFPDQRFTLGLFFVPVFWLLLYLITGFYHEIHRRSRLIEFGQTFLATLIGVLVIFFTIIINDAIDTYHDYYISLASLFSIHFFFTYTARLIRTTSHIHRLRRGEIGFNTLLIIGDKEQALTLLKNMEDQPSAVGNHFVGYLNLDKHPIPEIDEQFPYLGSVESLKVLIAQHKIEEVMIAIKPKNHHKIESLLNELDSLKVIVKIVPNIYGAITRTINMSTLYGMPLLTITTQLMPPWQANIKRLIDLTFSLIALILLLPLMLLIALAVCLSSRGPLFYSHQRVGRYGKPFIIYKFRSMVTDAEPNGPSLSKENDPRITRVGRFLRKTRLDELPQFYNVLRGEMSLVGPRPERQYFIDQIVERAPHYRLLQKVKPGITSWGQVKYGYAENVDQMVERLNYDIIYIENMTLYVDFKIMIYTIMTVLGAKGR